MTINKEEKVIELIEEHKNEDTLIVLKGISKANVGIEDIEIDDLIKNKRKYLRNLHVSNEVISYEEFILLRNNLLEFFDKIIIIDNNLYNNIYPLYANIATEKLNTLKNYYELEYEEDFKEFKGIDEIEEYLDIYGNYRVINNNNYIIYNNSILNSSEKIIYLNLYDSRAQLSMENVSQDEEVIEIIEEEDYIRLLENLNKKDKLFIKKLDADKEVYKERLELIKSNYENVELSYVIIRKEKKVIEKYDEYLDILKKYWKVDGFLDIPMYDTSKLEEGIKETIEVSQAEIIDSIVLESENSIKGEAFNDIFVTAPTGSGKSALFQIPAIYLGERYNLMTIVISPLIGLMNDQVKGLEKRNYEHSRTINSDISPIKKQEISEEIGEGKCHILYISPETLLSRSDISQLVGDRKIGLFVIDEAHIVTTWGKQFRPDYWFLGDRLKKMRKKQKEEVGHSFPIATFTATAIYGGIEDMYSETKESLNMPNPITYLGYIKRDNIDIRVKEVEAVRNREEYELDKFENIFKNINREIFEGRKTLIYFPTVKLIDRFLEYAHNNKRGNMIVKYHGQMSKAEKQESYEMFYNGDKSIMAATKAFGMGIDIDDIVTIIHFSPTGNVCDYIQEIGRAARKKDLIGRAYYEFMDNDFKYINRFHGVSLIKKYQLIQVIEKIHDLFNSKIKNLSEKDKGKKHSMLLDAESFSHIFQNDFFDEDDAINKVKTAMLIMQKDFENKLGFSPIYMRPIPIFSKGYFQINDKKILEDIKSEYGINFSMKDEDKNIIELNLEYIWEKSYQQYSFPKFKYLLYSKCDELDFKYKNHLHQALIVDIEFEHDYKSRFKEYISALEEIIYNAVRENNFNSTGDLTNKLSKSLKINKYRAEIMIDSFITTMKYYSKEHVKTMFGRMYTARQLGTDQTKYQFKDKISQYFKWINMNYKKLEKNIIDNKLYVSSEDSDIKEVLLFLGLLESFDLLSFRSLGGNSSQIYLHINQTQHLKSIIDKPYRYENKILSIVDNRHKVSVEMLRFLFRNEFESDEIWEHIENYFLGDIADEVKEELKAKYDLIV